MKYILVLLLIAGCGQFGLTPTFKVGDCLVGGYYISNYKFKIVGVNNHRYIVRNDSYELESYEYGYVNRNYAKISCRGRVDDIFESTYIRKESSKGKK